ncbi:MAG: tetratricopeptide repeat protein, partial [Gammaproteobacteria bacterium]
RPLADMAGTMDDILRNTVAALDASVLEADKLTVRKGWTTSAQAYDFYLQGLSYFRRYAMDNNKKALGKFEAAIQADPSFAKAWARLAECHIKYFMYHDAGNPEHVVRADEASNRALALAPDFARARTARGVSHLMKKAFREAEDEFEKAEELLPRQFDAWFWHARCCFQQGRLKKAIELFERAAEVQPDDYQTPLLLRQACLSLGRVEQAGEAAKRGLQLAREHLKLNPRDARAIYLACGAMIQLGMYDKAMEWADKVLALNPEDPMINYNVACCFAQAGEKERALDCLDKARNSGMVSAGWMKNDADLVSLHDHPRFQKLVAEIAR